MAETIFLIALAGLVLALLISTIRHRRRVKKRQESLHQGTDGMYYWTDFDGTPRKHHAHPGDRDGPWSDAGSGGGDFGGDGGGGGGD